MGINEDWDQGGQGSRGTEIKGDRDQRKRRSTEIGIKGDRDYGGQGLTETEITEDRDQRRQGSMETGLAET